MGNPYAADFADDTGQVRLGGEITFTDQANQPGGGSNPVGSSYLATFADNIMAVTDQVAVVFDSPADVKVGTDISINVGGDTFTINADGWYTITFVPQWTDGAGTANGTAEASIDVSGLDAADILAQMGPFQNTVTFVPDTPANAQFRGSQALGPFNFKSGDTFQAIVSTSLTAGALTFGGSLVVVRVG